MLELLYAALNSPLGVSVSTNDANRLRMELYALRAKSEDRARLAILSFCLAPDGTGALWIVKARPIPNGESPP